MADNEARRPPLLTAPQVRLYEAWRARGLGPAYPATLAEVVRLASLSLRSLQVLIDLGFLMPAEDGARYRVSTLPMRAGEHPLMRQRFYAVERSYRAKRDYKRS